MCVFSRPLAAAASWLGRCAPQTSLPGASQATAWLVVPTARPSHATALAGRALALASWPHAARQGLDTAPAPAGHGETIAEAYSPPEWSKAVESTAVVQLLSLSLSRRRLARAPEAVVGRPVGLSLPRSAQPPRTVRFAPKRRRSRAGGHCPGCTLTMLHHVHVCDDRASASSKPAGKLGAGERVLRVPLDPAARHLQRHAHHEHACDCGGLLQPRHKPPCHGVVQVLQDLSARHQVVRRKGTAQKISPDEGNPDRRPCRRVGRGLHIGGSLVRYPRVLLDDIGDVGADVEQSPCGPAWRRASVKSAPLLA
eukprot:scaffold50242_cov64-Phaeocystis_antarctica.AAC.2